MLGCVLILALTAVVACSRRPSEQAEQHAAPAPAVSAPSDAAGLPSEATASAAYEAKQYGKCAQQWMAMASSDDKAMQRKALYNAACCHALDGKVDLALVRLDAAIAAGFRDVELLEKDPDLASLHGDPRWARAVASTTQQMAVWESSFKAPQLRRELLAMVEEDQAARKAWMDARPESPDAAELRTKGEAIDKKNTRALKAAIARYGWPGKSVVGEDGAHAAWLLVQHADLDPALQKDVLARMKPMVESGEVTASDYAYLYDRVAVAEHRHQLYGTQFKGTEPFPIEDETNVDARRKSVGLGTMAEYKLKVLEVYGPQGPQK